MGRTTCLLLLLSSLWSLILCALQHQYVLVTTPKSWYDAQSYCREKYLDLATISDMGEMTMVLTAVEDKYDDAVWTGLYKGTTRTWHWSLADNQFYKDGERDYFIWGNNMSYNCGGFEDGKLYVVGCTLPYPSICFDGRQQGLQQYVLINQTMIWIDARDYCRTYYTDLVSVRNTNESQMLQQIVGDLQVWTGLFRDPWIWSDQTYSSFRNWRPSEAVYTDSSTLPCAAMLKSESGKWGELSCDEAHPFLCSFISGTIMRVKVRISSQESALDPNEPVAQNNVLEQIKQMLTNTNVIDVTHLKWMKNPDGSVFFKDVSAGGSSKSCSASDPHL